ncbi:putative inorganic phosphate cotransporter isoform X2 [Pectinophora gossypiella]|uniref:putative inorganic phosphate cotransporter isoform X2 n=1 Tax=Pectinophora gossypiella TaxID=13191 RepID=UPI00214E9AC0|nr:putative inorganic phosphate cotransporter isoform X2 [Pectinophora gossypiella]
MGLKPEDDKRPSKLAIMDDDDSLRPPEGLGQRHFVTFMLFLGMANAYIMRTNMSVAIVAMVNHTALPVNPEEVDTECGPGQANVTHILQDGPFVWSSSLQGYILSSFFYGYVVTQIPFGILSKKYGARLFLGIGMLVNSVFGLLVPVAAEAGWLWLVLVRFIQGLGEGPIVPCSHAMLAKWIPPNERSRMGAAVYAGAQFGTVVSMPLSGLLSEYGPFGGWPSIFYVFGLVGTVWCIAFLMFIYEDPDHCPKMKETEKNYIRSSLWGVAGSSVTKSPPTPWRKILSSMPFWAIMLAHMGQNYGYETLMTELPTFMRQVLHFSLKDNGFFSALPYGCMWLFSIFISIMADWMLTCRYFTHTIVRKLINSIGEYGPAVGLFIAAHTGCNPAATVAILAIGIGLNGGIYSGFKVNHLDISPRFAGILMSFTNCSANLTGLFAPIIAGYIIEGKPTQAQWRKVFYIAGGIYLFAGTFYNIFASGERQPWDNPADDEANAKKAAHKKAAKKAKRAQSQGGSPPQPPARTQNQSSSPSQPPPKPQNQPPSQSTPQTATQNQPASKTQPQSPPKQ